METALGHGINVRRRTPRRSDLRREIGPTAQAAYPRLAGLNHMLARSQKAQHDA